MSTAKALQELLAARGVTSLRLQLGPGGWSALAVTEHRGAALTTGNASIELALDTLLGRLDTAAAEADLSALGEYAAMKRQQS